jgi:hypothetical protein
MPKKPVTDLITDQEMAYVHLILSGTMNDRRAAVREKLVDQEAQGLRNLNLGRDQILARLWELANLNPEATRGSMAGQINALSMIVAIEGLIPDRRLAPSGTQSAAPPAPQIYVSQWRRRQKQAEGTEPGTNVEAQPGAPRTPEPEPAPTPAKDPLTPNLDRNQPSLANPFVHPEKLSRVPGATDYTFDTVLHAAGALRLPSFRPKSPFARGR